LLPSDLDGATAPPAGSPNYLLALGRTTSSLDFWKFHVDFTTLWTGIENRVISGIGAV
jgi:hypothetical protein